MCARAKTVGSHPAQHVRSPGANRQHEQDRGAGLCETDLKQRDRVVPSIDRRRRLKFHLRATHRRQIEGECGTLFESTAADAKCAGRCAGMGAGAWRGRAQVGTTAHDAWGSPAHRRLKAEPASSCKRLKASTPDSVSACKTRNTKHSFPRKPETRNTAPTQNLKHETQPLPT